MRWPWSPPSRSDAARVLGKAGAEKRAADARAKVRAKVNEMRAAMNKPPIDWSAL